MIVGDYNCDGSVDATDYVVWRKYLGFVGPHIADGDQDGTVDQDDHGVWRAHFGQTNGITLMSFSNDGITFTAPEPFQATKQWNLSSGNGTKTVRVKFKDAFNHESAVFSDTIELNAPPSEETIFIFANGKRIAHGDSTGKYFYHNDHLGSPVLITDSNGNDTRFIEYSPYGTIKSETDGSAPNPSLLLKHKFNSKELDPSTNLYDYGARHYDAQLGRFITPDTIDPDLENPQSLNRYSYTFSNPLKFTDPTGNIAESIFIGEQTLFSTLVRALKLEAKSLLLPFQDDFLHQIHFPFHSQP